MKSFSRLFTVLIPLATVVVLGLLWRTQNEEKRSAPSVPSAGPIAAPISKPPLTAQLPPLPAPAAVAGSVATPVATELTETDGHFVAFNSWAEKFQAADAPQAKAALVPEGETLAKVRRADMIQLMQSDPELALRRALPYRLRQGLPESVAALTEQPVQGRGKLAAIYYTPLPGDKGEVPPTEHQVVFSKAKVIGRDRLPPPASIVNKPLRTYTYGRGSKRNSGSGQFLHGIVMEDATSKGESILALDENPVRVLEAEEAKDILARDNAALGPICGFSAKPATLYGQFGEKYHGFCQPGHLQKLNSQIAGSAMLSPASFPLGGIGPAANPPDQLPPPGRSGTQGLKRLLLMPVLYADDVTPPVSQDSAQASAQANNQYYVHGSYETASWFTTVTPALRLPERKIYYGENLPTILNDAISVAATLGYFASEYDQTYVVFNSQPQAKFGGRSDGLLNGGVGAINHELGHNFGLGHANYWDTSGKNPGPIQPTNPPPQAPPPPLPIDPDSLVGHDDINAPFIFGLVNMKVPIEEYGNIYDVMGSGGGDFGAFAKWGMKWLPDRFVKTVTASTTNRIYAFDNGHIAEGRLYALRIVKDLLRDYWISHRQNAGSNPWMANGLEVDWGTMLLDTTPVSTAGKNDAAVIVGRTFADPARSLFLTPIAKGTNGAESFIDVVVQLGPFPDNNPPTISLSASSLIVTNGASLVFVAAAQDADGDALAYNWDFGDTSFGFNSATNSKLFASDGQYVVRCEVSDMKGGVASAYVVIIVGNPTTFTMSGRVTDVFGNPVAGVRVHNSGTPPPYVPPGPPGVPATNPPPSTATYRYSYTDSQGYYTIGNIPAGTYTNRAYIFGYRTEPLDFVDPVQLVGADAVNLNHVARPITHVTISQATAATEGPTPVDGVFTITRDGDFSGDLPLRFAFSGTATVDLDYTLTGNFLTNISVRTNMGMPVFSTFVELVIPDGLPSIDVNVTPIDDSEFKGVRNVTLTLLMPTNEFRYSTILTNILTTNSSSVITTNTMFVTITNQYRIPGWEARPFGPDNIRTWFQTDPTYILVGRAEASLDLIDDDPPGPPSVGLFLVDSDATESGRDSASVLFSRIGGGLEDLTVYYTLSGVASNGVDYTALPGVITIPANEESVTLALVAVNDLFVEGNELADITLVPDPSDGTRYGLISGAEFEQLIIIDDDLPLVRLYASDSTAPRPTGVGRVTIVRAGSLEDDLLVNYLVTGTAVSGVDFNTLSGSIVIPAGQLTAVVVITALPNSGSRGAKTVTILLSDSPDYNIDGQNAATVTIQDEVPTVTLATTTATASEGGAAGEFTVARTGPTTNSLLVYFEVGGSAVEGSDYAPIGTNVTIAIGSATAIIRITPLQDLFNEDGVVTGNDRVLVALTPSTNYNIGSPNSGTVTISDDDGANLPSVGFMLRNSTIREDGGQIAIQVRVTSNPETNRPVQIDYKITAGTALPTVNYEPIPGQTGILNFVHFNPPRPPDPFFAPEDGIQTIFIPILDDGVATANKNFTITLFNPSGYMTNVTMVTNMGTVYTNVVITHLPTNAFLGDFRNHTVTIVDIGVNQVSITPLSPLAYESGPTAGRFIVTRSGSTAKALTVSFAVTGTAAGGSDFNALATNGTVTIPIGTNAVELTVLPINDPQEEYPETILVTLLPRPGYSIGSPGSAGMLIISEDGTIQFTASKYSVLENAGQAVIGVQRSGNTNLSLTVDYRIVDGTATNGLDYSASPPFGTLSFPPGVLLTNITIQLTDDSLVEGDETVSLVLTNPTGGVPLGGQRTATLSILNDDTAFDFATNSYQVNENGGFARINVLRSGLREQTNTVVFFTSNILARADSDYVGTNIVLTLLPGETNAIASIQILDDDEFEGNETVGLYLSNPGGLTILGPNNYAPLTIRDDESSVQFATTNFLVSEYAGLAQVVIHRNGGTVNTLTVNCFTGDGTATNNGDYASNYLSVTFAGDSYVADTNGGGGTILVPGETDKTVLIPILDDLIGEGNEYFNVRLTNLAGPAFGTLPGSTIYGPIVAAAVTIIDNETPGSVEYEFTPGIGANNRVRSVALQSDQKVVFGGDFTTVNNVSFNRIARLTQIGFIDASFNPGAGADNVVYAVASQPDNRVLIGGAFLTVDGTNRARIARLNANGNLDLSFNPGSGANGVVRAIAVQADGRIVIGGDFTTVNGVNRARLARLNADGTLDTGFNPGANASVNTLAMQPDGRILVGGAFNTIAATGRNGVARLNASGSADASFNPGSGAAGVVNSIAVQSDGAILVGGAFNAFDGVARSFLVRLASTGTLDPLFNLGVGPNSAVNSVAVHVTGKIIIGGDFTSFNLADRHFFARLTAEGSLDPLFSIGSGANAPVQTVAVQTDTATIIGGDFTLVQGLPRGRIARIHGDERSNVTGVEFAQVVYSVLESDSTAAISVHRVGNTNNSFDVTFRTADGTATAPLDYSSNYVNLHFASGDITKTVNVNIANDLLIEGNEVFTVLLTDVSPNIDLSGLQSASVTIVDDERAFQFSTNSYVTAEETNAVAITVTRAGLLTGSASVLLSTANGTAQAGTDYFGTNQTLFFTNGESSQTISIPIYDDMVGELDETFTVSLSNPANAMLGTPSTATVTITNTDQTYGTFNFANTNRINIFDGTPAIPYPSTIVVSGVSGVVSRVRVALLNLSHTFPDDIDALLVVSNRSVMFMSDAGGPFAVNNVTLGFDDGAAGLLPDNAQAFTGTNRVSAYEAGDTMPAPAPAPPYGTSFGLLNGVSPNGTWSLYVADDRGADFGVIEGGWRLQITTVDPATVNDLSIGVTASSSSLMAGQALTYSIAVTNLGPLTATSVRVTNSLPPNVAFVSAVPPQLGSYNNFGNGQIVFDVGTLMAGELAQMTLVVTPLSAGQITNVVAVASAQADVATANSVASVVTTVTAAPVADLMLAISDAPDPLYAGQDVTYTINLTNLGPLVATGVTLTDSLPPGMAFVSAGALQGGCAAAGNVVTCNLGTLVAGGRTTITIVGRPQMSGLTTNVVTATSQVQDFTLAGAAAVTTVNPAADLAIYQIETSDPFPLGGVLTYTLVVTNRGPSTAAGVSLIDTVPSGAGFLGAFASQGSCVDLGGVLLCDLGPITNGGVVTVDIDIQPLNLGNLLNAAIIVAAGFDGNQSNNASTEQTTVFAVGQGLVITPTTNAAQLAAAVTASGSSGIKVTSTSISAHVASGAVSSGLFTVGTPPYTYGLTLPGIVISSGNVSDYGAGPNLSSGMTTAYGTRATGLQQNLLDPITRKPMRSFTHFDVTQLDIQFDMLPGFDKVEFKVVFGSEEYPEFVNSSFIDGFGIYLNGTNIAFTDGLPINIDHPAMAPVAGTELDGLCAPGGNPIMTFSALVEPGSTSNLLTFIVADTSDTVLDTTVYVSSLQGGQAPVADLSVSLTATPEPVILGSNLVYQAVVLNRGPNIATNAVLTDVLPINANYVSATSSQGGCSISNGVVTCLLGDLIRSSNAIVTITVTPVGEGRVTNTVSVASDLADLRANDNTATVVSRVVEPGTFVNVSPIALADAQPGIPYPSVITVAGMTGVISKVVVTLNEITHTFSDDLDILLFSPSGQRVVLMSDVGGGHDLNLITLRLDDAAATGLPDEGQIVSGTFKPTNVGPGDVWPAPAPDPPYGTTLAEFNGGDPNGNWKLYIADDRGADAGVMAGGWRLILSTAAGVPPSGPALSIDRAGATLHLTWPDTAVGYVLETTTEIGPSAIWVQVGGTPSVGGGVYAMDVLMNGVDAQFFRLRRTP